MPTDGAEHELSLFMEDTGWPYSSLDDYIKCWDELYYQPMLAYAKDMQAIPIDIQACFQVAHGSHLRREAMLWQKIGDPATVLHLLTTDLPPEMREPGTYMYDSLAFRDQWESKLLPHRASGRRSTNAAPVHTPVTKTKSLGDASRPMSRACGSGSGVSSCTARRPPCTRCSRSSRASTPSWG